MEKRILIIVGMHRSGTSFLARALNISGVYLGDLNELMSHELKSIRGNPKGHWEHQKLIELANETLSSCNGSWHSITSKITINEQLGKKVNTEIQKLNNFPALAYGFKDPRMLLIFNSWKPYMPKNIIIIGIFRNPLSVAQSLQTRDGFDFQKSINLWCTYNKKLLELLDSFPGFLINFDWSKTKILDELKLIQQKLNLPEINLNDWYSNDLIHEKKEFIPNNQLSKDVLELYSKLEHRSSINSSINVPKIVFDKNDLHSVIIGLLDQLRKNMSYFSTLNDNNKSHILSLNTQFNKTKTELENTKTELENTKTELEKFENYLQKIYNSITWKTLRNIDKIRFKFNK